MTRTNEASSPIEPFSFIHPTSSRFRGWWKCAASIYWGRSRQPRADNWLSKLLRTRSVNIRNGWGKRHVRSLVWGHRKRSDEASDRVGTKLSDPLGAEVRLSASTGWTQPWRYRRRVILWNVDSTYRWPWLSAAFTRLGNNADLRSNFVVMRSLWSLKRFATPLRWLQIFSF